MKYLTYWELMKPPFSKDILSKDLSGTDDLVQATKCLSFVKENGGIALIVGKPGSGKTTIQRRFVDDLPKGLFKVVYLNYSTVKGAEFYRTLAEALGLEISRKRLENFANIKQRIKDLKTKDRVMPIIILDEAQYLSRDILIDLPLLLNFEMDSKDYVALILTGTPGLSAKLNMVQHEALRDRIVSSYEVSGMSLKECKDYIWDRMRNAGCTGKVFMDSAITAAHAAANGSIRRLNNILNLALMIGCMSEVKEIDAEIIRQAVEEDTL